MSNSPNFAHACRGVAQNTIHQNNTKHDFLEDDHHGVAASCHESQGDEEQRQDIREKLRHDNSAR